MQSNTIKLDGLPFNGKKRLVDSALVEFRTDFTKHECDVGTLTVKPGDHVIVETDRGPFIGLVRSHPERKLVRAKLERSIIRKANTGDLDVATRNEEMEKQAFFFAIQRIRAHKLDMKLVRAQSAHDGSKIIFYFSADERVDFRSIVKDLAQKFRTRIEMFQIGARTGAGMIGGIGSCGRELCCSTFLSSFAPISIRLVREQGLSINPEKVSGQCGRLMCCLVYEQHVYRRLRKKLPRKNQMAITERGKGKIIDVDIIGKRVSLLIEGSRMSFGLDEIVIDDGSNRKVSVAKKSKTEGLWQKEQELAPMEKKKKPSRRKRSNSKKNTSGKKPTAKPNSNNEKKEGATSDAPKKKSRRRRRRKKPSSGDKKPGEQKPNVKKPNTGHKKPKIKKPAQKKASNKKPGEKKPSDKK